MRLRFTDITTFVKSAARKNGASAFVDQGIISGFNFLTFILLARWMETSAFGVYVLAFSALMFVQTIQHALVTRAHNVLGVRLSGAAFHRFSRSVVVMTAAVALLSMLVAGGFALGFYALDLSQWTTPTIGIGIALFPWLIQDAIRRMLYTSHRVGAAAVNDFLSYGLQAAIVGFLFFRGEAGSVLTVFIALGASSLIASLYGLFQLRALFKGWALSFNAFREDLATVWQYGKWLSTGEFVGWLGQNGHTWLIGGLLGAPLVAGYRAATYVTNLLNPFDLAVSNYLPVRASRILHEDGKRAMLTWLSKQALILALPYAVIAAGISLASFRLLDLFYDARYATGLLALVLSITVWGRFLGFIFGFARIGLMATERTFPILISQILSLVIFASVSTVMISWLGIVGAPLARIVLHVVVGFYLTNALLGEKRQTKTTTSASPVSS